MAVGGPIPTPTPPRDRLLSSAFVRLVLGHLLQALGYALMPLLPLYLQHLGGTRTDIGLIMATSALGGLAVRPLVGWALDAIGRRPTLLLGTASLVLGMGMLYAVTDLGPLIYLVRVLTGIGIGTLFTGYFAWAADLIPVSRRTEGIALFGISGLVPLAVGPFVQELGVDAADIRWLFPVIGGFIALSLPVLATMKEPPRAPDAPRPTLRAVGDALRARAIWPVWVATTVFAVSVATFMAFAVVSAEARGIERPASIWWTYAAGAVMVRLIGARLPDRVGTANMIAPALGVYALALLLAASASSTTALLAAGLLAGLGHGYCFPVLTSQVVSRAPDRVRGSAMAMFTGLWDLSALALTPIMGRIADAFDDPTMFAFTAVFGLLGLALWATLEHRQASLAQAQTRLG